MNLGIGGHHRTIGRTNDWATPPEILQALGPFDDDPCPLGGSGGLDRRWKGYVWLNPPYGQETGVWLKRLADHGNGIALVFARTETQMFFESVWGRASEICFLKGRLHFYRPDGTPSQENAGAPSVLIAYGIYAACKLAASRLPGAYISLSSSCEVIGCQGESLPL
jgi:DNA N-6-adenine-methyltransferase Dam